MYRSGNTSRRLLAPCLLLVFSVINGVQCGFGLNATVPSYTTAIAQSIGIGIIPIIKANGTIKIGSENGEVSQSLIIIANNLTKPMDKLLVGILAAATRVNVNVSDLFANITQTLSDTATAIQNAEKVADDLQMDFKMYLYQQLHGKIKTLTKALSSLADSLGTLRTQAEKAASESYPVSNRNVTTFINSTVIANLCIPLRDIRIDLSDIANIMTTSVSLSIQLKAYQTQLNTLSNSSTQNMQLSFNRTVIDVWKKVIEQQVNTVKSINQVYAAIVSRANDYNNGDISNLTQFLADMVTANSSFSETVELRSNLTMETVSASLQNHTDLLTKTLLDSGTKMVDNLDIANSSAYSVPCARQYFQQLQQQLVWIGKLSNCIKLESNAFRPTIQIVKTMLDYIRGAAVSIAVGLTTICQYGSSNCSSSYFAEFPEHSKRIQNRTAAVADWVTGDEQIVTGRIVSCLNATGYEFDESVRIMEEKFKFCLITGV
ncbi:uncharacterized protein LOC129773292 [Toxorhynchites rutilus septentrionalis]|uniref:uncharacterized protein LOC129773292 n=1 Tax=Toxorhynchites rutilus septentrionalis TaxID=329112 RepID=UPI00247AA0B7|nr:uncharacterized protein LOC129773292 [Toxorhynchites rutilus septentrionalis]